MTKKPSECVRFLPSKKKKKKNAFVLHIYMSAHSLPFQQQLLEEGQGIGEVESGVFQEVLEVNASHHQLRLQLRVHHLM